MPVGITAAIGAILSIADKLLPNRKSRLNNELHKLEKYLEQALINNDAYRISVLHNRMRQVRDELRNIDQS